MKVKITILILGLTGLLFSGCMVGPEFQAPELESPTTYRFDTIQADSINGNITSRKISPNSQSEFISTSLCIT